jgi:hypothetical protein
MVGLQKNGEIFKNVNRTMYKVGQALVLLVGSETTLSIMQHTT